MKIKCYAVLDSKIRDFHLAIFDIEHDGAIRQFSDAVNNKETRWNRHPEDYSLWFVGEFDSSKGSLKGDVPENLVNGVSVVALRGGASQMDLFEKPKEEVVS